MLHRSAKVVLAAGAIVAVLGTGVALADTPVCPWGKHARVGRGDIDDESSDDRAQQRPRRRDGTGPRHAQPSRRDRSGGTQGRAPGNQGAGCPYRS